MAVWVAVVVLTALLVVGWLLRPRAPEPDAVPDLRVPSDAPTLGGPVNTPRPYPPSPLPSSAMAPAPPAQEIAEYRWSVQVKVLRPDLDAPQLVLSPDGSADDVAIPQAKGVWMVMTGQTGIAATPRVPDAKVRVHGLDAATGRELWQREMPFGLCATQLLDDKLACASSLARDDRTGLPTRWRLHLLDPATGKTLAQRDVDAWLAMLTVRQDRLVLVEQRQPAPHLAVSGYSSALAPVWRADLAKQALHLGFFSHNRFVYRPDLSPPDGLALQKVRFRQVDSMLTLWSTGPTAFLNLADGKVLGVPRCSRMYDDGQRIWCNERQRAVAWSRDLAKVVARTEGGVRLAHPTLDLRHGGRSVPIFVNPSGQVVQVDATTGRTGAVIADTAGRETFAGPLEPSTTQAGGTVLIDDSDGIIGLDAAGQRARWAAPDYLSARVLSHGDKVLVQDRGRLDVLDPATGRVTARLGQLKGQAVVAVGSLADDTFASIGMDEVARLQMP